MSENSDEPISPHQVSAQEWTDFQKYKASKSRTKGIYIGAPACFKLEQAIRHVAQAFGAYKDEYNSGIYLVGSCLEQADWRDVDIRFMMDDRQFKELFPRAQGHWEHDERWLLLTVCISDWLSKQTGLPIDFQFQPASHGNEKHGGKRRSALGLSFVFEE